VDKDKKSGRTIVALSTKSIIIGGRYTPANIFALERGLQFGCPLALPRLGEVGVWGHLALMLAVEVVLQPLEGNHHDRYIIQSLLIEGQFHYILHCPPAELVDVLEAPFISLEGVPHDLDYLSIR